MKEAFYASLCYQGARGGALFIDDDSVIYKNETLTIPNEYKNLVMLIKDIEKIEQCRVFIFPAVIVHLSNQRKHKFIVFNRKRFLRCLRESGVNFD